MKQKIKENLEIIIILSLYIPIILFTLNYKIATTRGLSMYPTIQDGEKLLIAQNKEPEVGDIVSVHINKQFGTDSEYIVKRVADIRDGQMYLLGDNTEVSYDSRYYGYVPLEMLDGVVVYHH